MRESRLIQRGIRVSELFFEKKVTRSAAELSYFITLSFFPILICLNWLVGTLQVNIERMLVLLEGIIPKGMQGILSDYLEYVAGSQSHALLVAGLIAMLTTSSAAFRSLLATMDDLYGRKSPTGLWPFVSSFVFSLVFLLAVYGSVLIVVTGSWFLGWADRLLGVGQVIGGWGWARFAVLFIFLLLLLWAFYRFVTRRRMLSPLAVAPGAIFATLALVVVSMLFSWFIGLSTRYALVYGSLASMIILMTWIYICGNIVILGGIINRVWEEG